MNANIKSLAVIRLLQVKDLSQEILEWLEGLDEQEIVDMWEGRKCIPNEQYVKIEELIQVTDTVNDQLKKKLVSCKIA